MYLNASLKHIGHSGVLVGMMIDFIAVLLTLWVCYMSHEPFFMCSRRPKALGAPASGPAVTDRSICGSGPPYPPAWSVYFDPHCFPSNYLGELVLLS